MGLGRESYDSGTIVLTFLNRCARICCYVCFSDTRSGLHQSPLSRLLLWHASHSRQLWKKVQHVRRLPFVSSHDTLLKQGVPNTPRLHTAQKDLPIPGRPSLLSRAPGLGHTGVGTCSSSSLSLGLTSCFQYSSITSLLFPCLVRHGSFTPFPGRRVALAPLSQFWITPQPLLFAFCFLLFFLHQFFCRRAELKRGGGTEGETQTARAKPARRESSVEETRGSGASP